jgi:hypothetical protein
MTNNINTRIPPTPIEVRRAAVYYLRGKSVAPLSIYGRFSSQAPPLLMYTAASAAIQSAKGLAARNTGGEVAKASPFSFVHRRDHRSLAPNEKKDRPEGGPLAHAVSRLAPHAPYLSVALVVENAVVAKS